MDIFQVVGDQDTEVDLVDEEGITVDTDMFPIGDEVESEVVKQALQDLSILKLVMSTESEVIGP